jgi:hypothetical protein
LTEPLFDMEPEPEPEPPEPVVRLTERDMLDLLHQRFGGTSYNGGVEAHRYVRAEHVRAESGFDRRTADFIAVDTWASSGHPVHGVEVKVSRSDWLREMKDPWKAQEFVPFMTYWWLAVADKAIVRDGELPDGWGLLAPRRGALFAIRTAPKRDAEPLTPARMAALLRAVDKTAHARGYREGYASWKPQGAGI